MVALAVESLGIYLGPQADLDAFHMEDQTMNRSDMAVVFRCIADRTNAHTNWGWKDPAGLGTIIQVLHALQHPRVIIVLRDILASVQGEMRFDAVYGAPARPFPMLLYSTLRRYEAIVDFVQKTQVPALLVSYERAIANREAFVDELVEFLGISPGELQRNQAISRISPKGGYLTPKKEDANTGST